LGKPLTTLSTAAAVAEKRRHRPLYNEGARTKISASLAVIFRASHSFAATPILKATFSRMYRSLSNGIRLSTIIQRLFLAIQGRSSETASCGITAVKLLRLA